MADAYTDCSVARQPSKKVSPVRFLYLMICNMYVSFKLLMFPQRKMVYLPRGGCVCTQCAVYMYLQ